MAAPSQLPIPFPELTKNSENGSDPWQCAQTFSTHLTPSTRTQGTHTTAKMLAVHKPVHPARDPHLYNFGTASTSFLGQQEPVPFPASAPTPHETSGRGSSCPRQPPSATNLGMLCKYRRRRTSSVVLQWGFNQTVFLVVIIATARPDLSLVPVKGRKIKSCKDVKLTEPGSRCERLIPLLPPSSPSWECCTELDTVYAAHRGGL